MGFLGRLGRGRSRRRTESVQVTSSAAADANLPTVASERVAQAAPPVQEQVQQEVPHGIRIAGAWSWRLIVIAIAVYGIGWLTRYLSEVTVPIAVSILLAALISPVANWFIGRKMPRGLATALSMVIGLVLVSGTLTLISVQLAGQAVEMGGRVAEGFTNLTNWLASGPLPIPERYLRVDELTQEVTDFLSNSSSVIAGYAQDFGTQIGRFFAGLAITLFATFYFLYDGRGIWRFLLKLAPGAAQERIDDAGRKGWNSLVHYVRATILVAFVDAIGVLIIALILRVPGAPALAALVFLGAFVPLVGALVSGFVAVLVALVMLGWVQAVIMLAGIIVVMQLEGHILQPFLLGRAVKLHPLAVLLGIAIGVIVAGIVGAVIAIPLLAFANSFIRTLASNRIPAEGEPVATTVR